MKYLYSSATRFKDQSLISEINEAAFRLATKLSSIDLLSIGLSEYNANYLMNNFKNPISTIQQNAHLLALCLQDRNVDKENFVIVD